MPLYTIPTTHTVSVDVDIVAETLDDAIAQVKRGQGEPHDEVMVDGSIQVDEEYARGTNTKSYINPNRG